MAHMRTGALFGRTKKPEVAKPKIIEGSKWVARPKIDSEKKSFAAVALGVGKSQYTQETKQQQHAANQETKQQSINQETKQHSTNPQQHPTITQTPKVKRSDLYNTPAIRSKISQILNIANNNAWKVCDYDKDNDIAIIDRNDKCDIYDPSLRGIVVQLSQSKILVDRYNPAVNVIADALETKGGALQLKDVDGFEHKINLDQITLIDCVIEGLLIHVFKFNNKIYVANNSNLNVLDAFGPDVNRTFGMMFKETGVDVNTLFDADKANSLFVHSFIMVVPDFQRVSNLIQKTRLIHVRTGRATYAPDGSTEVTPKQLPPSERNLLKLDQVNAWLRDGCAVDIKSTTVAHNSIHNSTHSQTHNSTHTSTPHNSTHRASQGEAVHLVTKDGREFVIKSSSWDRKDKICHSLDMSINFYDLIMKKTEINYNVMYSNVPLDKLKSIPPENLCFWPDKLAVESDKYQGGKFCYAMFATLLLSAPVVHKKKVIEIYEKYLESRNRLVKWVKNWGPDDRALEAKLVFPNDKSAYKNLLSMAGEYGLKGGNVTMYVTALGSVDQVRLFKLAYKYGPKLDSKQ